MRYEAYCLIDPDFYDTPARAKGQSDNFELSLCPAPNGWVRSDLDNWVVLTPDGVDLPPQGWKIHVSACLDDARDTLTAVWHYCVPRRIAFKFLPSEDSLLLANAKYAPRESSGKFVTIYPLDEAQLATVLHELGAVLAGRPGPYVLGDLRWSRPAARPVRRVRHADLCLPRTASRCRRSRTRPAGSCPMCADLRSGCPAG